MWQEVWLLTIEIKVSGFPTFNTMYWHFLVKRDVGPTFLYQYCPLCPYESRKTNISPKKPLKQTFQLGNFWDWNVHCSLDCLICHPESWHFTPGSFQEFQDIGQNLFFCYKSFISCGKSKFFVVSHYLIFDWQMLHLGVSCVFLPRKFM